MSPKQRRTGGGQKCPLRREELKGDKIVPGKRRNKFGRYKGRSYIDARFLQT